MGGTKKKNIKKGNNKKIENNKKNLSDILKDNENDDNDYNDLQDEIENCDHSKKKEVKIIADHKNYAKEGAVALDTLRSIIELAKKKKFLLQSLLTIQVLLKWQMN